MTHKDIYTKFMIEYDKANVTSSYPSLTEYEVATLLDKAYLALIAQKVTGNNPRRSPFEADVKSVADVQPLVTHKELVTFNSGHEPATNITQFELPTDYLYSVLTLLNYAIGRKKSSGSDEENTHLPEDIVYSPSSSEFENIDTDNPWVQWYETYSEESNNTLYVEYQDVYGDNQDDILALKQSAKDEESTGGPMHIVGDPYDTYRYRYLPCKLVPHETAEKFFCTPYNMPWVKIPVCFIEENTVYIAHDPVNIPSVKGGSGVHFIYIRKPKSFVKYLGYTEPESEEPENNNPSNPDPTNPSHTNTDPVGPDNLDPNPVNPDPENPEPSTDNYVTTIVGVRPNTDSSGIFSKEIDHIYDESNKFSFYYYIKKNDSYVISDIEIVSGGEYAELLPGDRHYYNAKIKNTATDYKPVTLRIFCPEDKTVYEDYILYVKYNSANDPIITPEQSNFKLDHSKLDGADKLI